jgi:hypothetical protein
MLQITHTGNGTLVRGTVRGHPATPDLKAQGFRWSRKARAWYLPRALTFVVRDHRVAGLMTALNDKGLSYTLYRSAKKRRAGDETWRAIEQTDQPGPAELRYLRPVGSRRDSA